MKYRQHRISAYRLVPLAMAVLLAACGAGGARGALNAGQKYFANGKYRAAYIEAKKVLQQDNSNGSAWLLLGKTSLMLGHPQRAVTDFQNARAHGVSDGQWEVPMARALLVTRKYETLIKTIKPGKALPVASRARVFVLRGEALLALHTTEAAKYSYQQALGLEPKNVLALIGLAKVASATHDLDAAHQYTKKALSLEPENAAAWTEKGDIAFLEGDIPSAETAYKKAISINTPDLLPQQKYYLIAKLAESQIRQNKLKAALEQINTLQKMSPAQPYGHYLHAAVDFKQGKWDDATNELQQVLKVLPNSEPAQLLMGAVNFAQSNLGQAEMYLSNVLGMDSKNVAARKLLAVTLYREGESQEALRVLRPLFGSQASDAKMLAVLQQQAATGVHMFSGEGAGSPDTAQSHLAHASALAAKGNLGEAIRLLKEMPKGSEPEEYARTRMLAVAYLQEGKQGKAEEVAAEYEKQNPKKSAAHFLYGTVLVAVGKDKLARGQLSDAYQLDKKNAAALISLGALDVLEKHYDSARERYQAALKVQPENALAMASLAELEERVGHRAEAIRGFKKAIRTAPKMGVSYLDLALIYSREGKFPEALKVAKAYLAKAPNEPAALNAVGAAELNSGNYKEATAPLTRAVKTDPRNPLYRVNLARANILNHDFAAAEKNLNEAIKSAPGEERAVAMLAYLKARGGDFKGAISLADKLEQAKSTRLAGEILKGDLYMSDRAYGKADRAYTRALKSHYSRALVIKVFSARSYAGRANAQTVLEPWLAKHPDDEGVRLLLGDYYMGHGKYAKSAVQYQHVLHRYPNNVAALNDLAWVYTQQKKTRNTAVSYARRAYKLAPKAAPVQDTYGWALVLVGKAERAVPILESAVKAMPKDPGVHYHLAVAQARSGDKASAVKTLRTLLQATPKFLQRPAAEKLYRELSGSETGP